MQNLPWMHPVCREVRVYCCGHAPLGWSSGVAWELGNGSRSSSNARNQGQEMYQIEMMTLMLMVADNGCCWVLQSRCGRHLHATPIPFAFGDEETAHARVVHVPDPEHPEATDHLFAAAGESKSRKCKAPKFGGGARVMHSCFFPFPANSLTIFPPF
ncbi:hypothetical protein BO83DRAFT_410485 [Aspergillus eucalypticola CBS 122712]|uniref:Uncharacterized protein n=1 Tax=Aspergillus eucalypticola (strain CBS 122712 / IBT 29274) TaxID=1448314 RepID=A0A317UY24_ASPEC|nr:uncharacterized protein BO83DRAFT_410485 [Aspergillus eucalypticola CBS 122712]PWY66635.1 hypothetical protein BO83DRAFT_410485 [Aspergillus eucalypticola CBS 122712]